MTARHTRRRLALADDGIIDPIAVDIATRGARTVALIPAERQLAAARILARGGTPYLISKRLHINGPTALTLAARYQALGVMTPVLVLADDGNGVIATGAVPKGHTAGAIRAGGGDGGWTPPGQVQEMSYLDSRRIRPAGVPARPAPTGKANGGPQ